MSRHRTQVMFEDGTYRELKRCASQRSESIAAILGEKLDIKAKEKRSPGRKKRLTLADLSFVGMVSEPHPFSFSEEDDEALVKSIMAKLSQGDGDRSKPKRKKRPPQKTGRLSDFTFIGSFSSGKKDNVSERHDEILGEARW